MWAFQFPGTINIFHHPLPVFLQSRTGPHYMEEVSIIRTTFRANRCSVRIDLGQPGAWPRHAAVRTPLSQAPALVTIITNFFNISYTLSPQKSCVREQANQWLKKGASSGSIKRFLAAEPEDLLNMDGLGRSSRGTGSSAGSASRHRPASRHHSPASSACSDGEGSTSRRSEVAALVSDLPTKSELASMFLGLERSIKKELSAERSDLSQVLECVEETEHRLDRHTAAIRSLQNTTRSLTIAHRMALYKIEDQENRNWRNNIRI